jgi:hypothetical protein
MGKETSSLPFVISLGRRDLGRGFRNLTRRRSPLKSFWLPKTGWFINQFVYRLNGLTEAEIKIVKGKSQVEKDVLLDI